MIWDSCHVHRGDKAVTYFISVFNICISIFALSDTFIDLFENTFNSYFVILLVPTALIPDTVILKDDVTLIEHLLSFLNNRKTPLKLCYRASVNGWSSQQFHQHCDDKEGTVVLVKVGNYIFGGFTDQTWQGIRISQIVVFNSHHLRTFYAHWFR